MNREGRSSGGGVRNFARADLWESGEAVMRIQGQELTGHLGTVVELDRGDGQRLSLRLQPLPLGFQRQLMERGLLMPQPPVRMARDASGRPQRDPQGGVVTLRDERDPDYLMAADRYHQRVAVLALAESLRNDPQVEFRSQPPVGHEAREWCAYADALFQELEEAGFTVGDLARLCERISRMSRLLTEHLQTARGSFLPAKREGAD